MTAIGTLFASPTGNTNKQNANKLARYITTLEFCPSASWVIYIVIFKPKKTASGVVL